ncbi:MAG TPA: GntR family transcriptional regulator, partial [Inquilinus sp.]
MTKPAGEAPHYLRIKDAILARIAEGTLKPGDRVYSESELVASFGVSRMTANRALRELMFEGVLTRATGLGTFVSSQRQDIDLLQIRNIADEISGRGHRHTAKVLIADRIKADATIAQSLDLAVGIEVMHTLIVHLEDDQPIQVEERYVNPI